MGDASDKDSGNSKTASKIIKATNGRTKAAATGEVRLSREGLREAIKSAERQLSLKSQSD